jgi:hypothetical protein
MQIAIDGIRSRIENIREEIIHHKVYSVIKDLDDLKIFMQHHVYAVWDFMSLLKSLQQNLTCTSVPWFPVGNADTRFLINEIVVGEEADVDPNGVRMSHFELYLSAMRQCNADTSGIELFIERLQAGADFDTAFQAANTPDAAKNFVNFTFSIIHSKKDYLQSAIFTFGREDLIPGMFLSLVNDIHQAFPNEISLFKYYLERHIEVDGDHHSHLAMQMTSLLCKSENHWQEAEEAIIQSLQQRVKLWDGVYDMIMAKNEVTA